MLEWELDRACMRALFQNEVDGEILHRRVKKLLDGAGKPVDLIHEQDAAPLQIRENPHEIARSFEGRAGRRDQAPLHLVGYDVGEGRLAQSGWSMEKHVVQRFLALAGRLD